MSPSYGDTVSRVHFSDIPLAAGQHDRGLSEYHKTHSLNLQLPKIIGHDSNCSNRAPQALTVNAVSKSIWQSYFSIWSILEMATLCWIT